MRFAFHGPKIRANHEDDFLVRTPTLIKRADTYTWHADGYVMTVALRNLDFTRA